MTILTSRVPLLLGTAATALLLVACGANEVGEPEGAGSETPLSRIVTASPSPSGSASASASAGSSPSTGASSDSEAELEVEDQSGDGSSVSVQGASTSAGTGFVAIYRGEELLGSVQVGTGTLTVELDTPVPATAELKAVLFGDDGDGKLGVDQDPRLGDKDFDYTVS